MIKLNWIKFINRKIVYLQFFFFLFSLLRVIILFIFLFYLNCKHQEQAFFYFFIPFKFFLYKYIFVVLDPFYAWLITFYSKFDPINLLNYKYLSYIFFTWSRQLFNYFNMIVHIEPSFSFISWIFLSLWSISPSSLGHYLSTIKILSNRLILSIIPWNIFMSVIIIHSSWCYIIRLSCTLYFMNL